MLDTYTMSYHTILKNSKDYYEALRSARNIADQLTKTINKNGVEVFPYRYIYSFLIRLLLLLIHIWKYIKIMFQYFLRIFRAIFKHLEWCLPITWLLSINRVCCDINSNRIEFIFFVHNYFNGVLDINKFSGDDVSLEYYVKCGFFS